MLSFSTKDRGRAALLTTLVVAAILYVSDREGWIDFSELGISQERGKEASLVTEAVAPRETEADPRTINPINGSAGPSAPVAVPPMVGPLKDNLAYLVSLAEAGNPTASCRLVIATSRCREVLRNARYTLEVQRSLENRATPNDKTAIDVIAQSIERGNKHAAFCQGLTEADLPETSTLVAKSLSVLSPRQKTILALTRFDGSLRLLQRQRFYSESGLYVLPQYLADYTMDFLMEGFRARDPLALEGLVMVHAPATLLGPVGVALWLPNPKLYLYYTAMMYEIYGPESLPREAQELARAAASAISPEELAQIQSKAQTDSRLWRSTTEPGVARGMTEEERGKLSDCNP